MFSEYFVIVAALLNLCGSSSYLFATLKGKVRPNKVTWLLWAVAPLIAFSAEVQQGVGLASLMTFMVGFGPLMIFVASFVNKKAAWKVGRFDVACGFFSVAGLVLWYLTKVGNVAILLSIIADALAGLPTIVKSYRAPGTEDYKIYFFGSASALITLLAIPKWDFANFGFPLYILLISLLLFVLIKFNRLLRKY